MAKELTVKEFLEYEGVVVDVRSESEFATGHIEGAYNIPLFSDAERAEIGTIYVRKSKELAIERGLEIVGPKMANFVKQAKQIAQGRVVKIHCWRGGMRSKSMQWLFETAGIRTVLLQGGYKAYRACFLDLLDEKWDFIVIAGKTGCGKTEILQEMRNMGEQVLDLEGLAKHKGSAFGALGQESQPTTEQFINLIFHELLKFDVSKPVWVEGESMLIGHVFIPQKLFQLLNNAKVVMFSLDKEKRVDRIMKMYGNFSVDELKVGFDKIHTRLGCDNYKFAIEALEQGQIRKAAEIALLYYDKSYTKSIQKRESSSVITVETIDDDVIENARKIIQVCK